MSIGTGIAIAAMWLCCAIINVAGEDRGAIGELIRLATFSTCVVAFAAILIKAMGP